MSIDPCNRPSSREIVERGTNYRGQFQFSFLVFRFLLRFVETLEPELRYFATLLLFSREHLFRRYNADIALKGLNHQSISSMWVVNPIPTLCVKE